MGWSWSNHSRTVARARPSITAASGMLSPQDGSDVSSGADGGGTGDGLHGNAGFGRAACSANRSRYARADDAYTRRHSPARCGAATSVPAVASRWTCLAVVPKPMNFAASPTVQRTPSSATTSFLLQVSSCPPAAGKFHPLKGNRCQPFRADERVTEGVAGAWLEMDGVVTVVDDEDEVALFVDDERVEAPEVKIT